MKLASKIILMMVVAVFAVTAVSSHFTSRQFVASIEQQHQEIADSIDRLAGDPNFHRAIQNENLRSFYEMVRLATEDYTSVRWIWIRKSELSEPHLRELSQSELRKPISRRQRREDGSWCLNTYYLMQSGGERGAIEISSPLSTVSDQTRQAWFNALMSITAIGLLAIGVVMLGGVRMIARPLQALTDKMNRIGEGDFASDVELKSDDELGQLATALNQMCDRLRQQNQAIAEESAARAETQEQLRHSDRLKTVGQLAAGFAHEVGTPLNVIGGRAGLLMADTEMSSEEIRKNAAAIKAESERISGIVQKLLDFARQRESKQAEGDLREVIQQSVELLQPLARNREIELSVELPETPARSKFDFHQIQQVMINLLDNAVDASSDGTTVEVGLHQQQSKWQIVVRDQGRGIPREHLDQILEPFFTTKEVGRGTGLGLSIVHGIVEDHGGTLEIESTPAQGTRVTVTLNALPQDLAENYDRIHG